MKTQSITNCLSTIKWLVDSISSAGVSIDVEDIILYILNDFPSSYEALKTSICTHVEPLSLDDLYSLLCSEEINIAIEVAKDLNLYDNPSAPDAQFILVSFCAEVNECFLYSWSQHNIPYILHFSCSKYSDQSFGRL